MEITGWDSGFEQASGQCPLEKGESALCGGKYSEAEDHFGRVLTADPFNAKAHRGLSDAYWAQGKIEDALNSITRALELEPGDRDTVLACTRIFKAFGKDDFAKEVLKSYLDKNPQDAEVRSRMESLARPANQNQSNDVAEVLLRLGETQFERGNIARAAACFEMAIEQNPRMALAYNNMGVIFLQSGKTMEALENFKRALDLKPGDPDILSNSARALVMAGQIDTAIEVQREYLRRCPENGPAWQEYESMVRRTAGSQWRPDGLSGEVADIYKRTAEMLGKAGDFAGAAEAVERALKIEPEAPESLCVLAWLHCEIGQKDEAEGILDQALKIDPSHARCADMLRSIRNGAGALPARA
jgi:tetratricopeptide (TPR) repeat protein